MPNALLVLISNRILSNQYTHPFWHFHPCYPHRIQRRLVYNYRLEITLIYNDLLLR